jgi:hypothetical protein
MVRFEFLVALLSLAFSFSYPFRLQPVTDFGTGFVQRNHYFGLRPFRFVEVLLPIQRSLCGWAMAGLFFVSDCR